MRFLNVFTAAVILILFSFCGEKDGQSHINPDSNAEYNRIISQTLLSDHIISALGLVAVQKTVAISPLSGNKRFDAYPNSWPADFTRWHSSAAGALKLNPDLVIISPYTSTEKLETLKAIGTRLVSLPHITGPDSYRESIELIGRLTGTSEKAAGLISDFNKEWNRQPAVEKKRQILLYSDGFTAGSGTTFDAVVTAAGHINAAAGLEGHRQITVETVVSLKPDYLISGCYKNCRETAERLRKKEGLSSLLKSGTALKTVPEALTGGSGREMLELKKILGSLP